MANTDKFVQLLKSENRPFSPRPFYERLTDSIIFYFVNTSSYAKRVNRHFTVFLDDSSNRVVGFEIKGVQTIHKAIQADGFKEVAGPITIDSADGEIELSVMCRTAFIAAPEFDHPGLFEEVNRISSGKRCKVEGFQTC